MADELERAAADLAGADVIAKATQIRNARIEMARRGDKAAAIELFMRDGRVGHPHFGKPIRLGPVHERWLDLAERTRRKIVWGPPKSGKSEILTVGRLVCRLGENPNRRVAIVTADRALALKMVGAIKALIEGSEMVRTIWPHLKPGRKWTDTELYVDGAQGRDPTVRAASTETNITGSRVDDLVLDDVLTHDNTQTEMSRDKTWAWFHSSGILGRTDETTDVVVMNNCYHPNDLAHRLEKEEAWAAYRFPVIDEEGNPTCGDLWTPSAIEAQRRVLGPLEFARQMLCKPYDEKTQRFRETWILDAKERGEGRTLVERIDDLEDGCFVVTGVDLGAAQTAKADETVLFTILVWPNGDWEPIAIDDGRWTGDVIRDRILSCWGRMHSERVIVENEGQQKLLIDIIAKDTPVPVVAFRPGTMKTDPALGLEAMAVDFANGKVIIPNQRGVCHPSLQHWIDEMTTWVPGNHPGDRLVASWLGWEYARRRLAKVAAGANGHGGVTVIGGGAPEAQEETLADRVQASASVQDDERVILVGGPMRGKSTYARRFRVPIMCTDARSQVREPDPDVEYLPEGLEWSAASAYVAEHWLTRPGPWVIEGVATARALRKWFAVHAEPPADRVLLFVRPAATPTDGQERMAAGVMKVWSEVADLVADRTETVDVRGDA